MIPNLTYVFAFCFSFNVFTMERECERETERDTERQRERERQREERESF